MTGVSRPILSNLVRDALERDGAYDFGLGVVLRAPTDPTGSGGSASYRIEYRVEPVLPGRPLSSRKETYARDLAKAYGRAVELFAEMKERAGGTYVEYGHRHALRRGRRAVVRLPAPAVGRELPEEGRQHAAVLGDQ